MRKLNRIPGKWRQISAAIIMCIGSFLIGVSSGWTSRVFQNLQEFNNVLRIMPFMENELSWLASGPFIGQLSAMLWGSNLCELVGRKRAAIIVALLYITIWLLRLSATHIDVLLVSQLLQGVSDGLITLTVPVYLTEIASNSIRGLLVATFTLSIKIGYLFSFILAAVLSYKVMIGVILIMPTVQLIALLVLPESPTYLLRMHRAADAKKSLMWLRGNDETIAETDFSKLEHFHRTIKSTKSSSGLKDLFLNPTNLKGFLIAISMTLIQQFSGAVIMILYIIIILNKANTPIDVHIASIIYACVYTCACWLSTLTVDRYGRRPLLLFSTAGMTIAHGTLGVYFTLQNLEFDVDYIRWLPILGLYLFGMSFSGGVGPLVPVVSNEVVNPEFASICNSIQLVTLSTLACLLIKLFPILTEVIGFQNCFYVLTMTCAASFFTVLFFIPETKGKSLESIREGLQKKRVDSDGTQEEMEIMSTDISTCPTIIN